MKKILFLDRDGVILKEPPSDYQIDSFEKFEFVDGVISALSTIAKLKEFELVMITNQDGLGTDIFPEDTFWGPHNLMIKTLKNEGIHFREVHIDRSFTHEMKDTRKPGIGLLRHFTHDGEFDLENSLVIGDRLTDMLLAKNLGCKGIFLGKSIDQSDDQMGQGVDLSKTIILRTNHWSELLNFILSRNRVVAHERNTKETQIKIKLDMDGQGISNISTGLAFFDHMLDQVAKHGKIDLEIVAKGDLYIDEHHTVEDTALSLGEAFRKALGNKRGIERYGFCLPMDDALARVALDFGGRPWLIWEADFKREKIGDLPTELFYHFFKSFSDTAQCNLNIKAEGDNEHHKIEAIFKAFARAIKMAKSRSISDTTLPSTKGVL